MPLSTDLAIVVDRQFELNPTETVSALSQAGQLIDCFSAYPNMQRLVEAVEALRDVVLSFFTCFNSCQEVVQIKRFSIILVLNVGKFLRIIESILANVIKRTLNEDVILEVSPELDTTLVCLKSRASTLTSNFARYSNENFSVLKRILRMQSRFLQTNRDILEVMLEELTPWIHRHDLFLVKRKPVQKQPQIDKAGKNQPVCLCDSREMEKVWNTVLDHKQYIICLTPPCSFIPWLAGIHPGTRTSILEELEQWVTTNPGRFRQPQSRFCMLWGASGTGKSSIAQHLNDRLREKGILCALFSFTRDQTEQEKKMISTIAYQFQTGYPQIYPHLLSASRSYIAGQSSRTLDRDFDEIIVKPLNCIAPSYEKPMAIIIEALDVCTGANPHGELLSFIRNLHNHLAGASFLHIILTSTPEINIQSAIRDLETKLAINQTVLHKVPREIVDADISLYLNDSLRKSKNAFIVQPDIIAKLTELSEGNFTFARSALDFITSSPVDAQERLNALSGPSGMAIRFPAMDHLFASALYYAFLEWDLDRPSMKSLVQDVLGTMALLRSQIYVQTLRALTNVSFNRLFFVLNRLGSILYLTGERKLRTVCLVHSSFKQFILDPSRCRASTFHIDPTIHHTRIAVLCLNILEGLPPVEVPQSLDEKEKEEKHDGLSLEMEYACFHWTTHLSLSSPSELLLTGLEKFFSHKSIAWAQTLDRLTLENSDGSSSVAALRAVRAWYNNVPAEKISTSTLWKITQQYRISSRKNTGIRDFTPVDLSGLISRNEKHATGGGGYADVYKGVLSIGEEKTNVAIKVIRAHIYTEINKWKIIKRLRREIRLWGQLQHPNVLPFLGVTSDFGPHEAMVCPWMEDGDLNHYLETVRSWLTLSHRLDLLADVSEGLSYLHARAIIHGDLTTANILIDKGRACLCDFGLSNIMAKFQATSLITSTVAGACRWAAPELFPADPDNNATPQITEFCDIYSFGSITLQVISGRMPYDDLQRNEQVLLEMFKGNHPRRPSEPLLTDDFWNFISRCWNTVPDKRPNIDIVKTELAAIRACSVVDLYKMITQDDLSKTGAGEDDNGSINSL